MYCMKMSVLILLLSFFSPLQKQKDTNTQQREAMVNTQIESRGIKDSSVLAAMHKVPRHLFVPAGEVSNAYEDRPLPIGYGQTISQPYIVAYMTEIIKPKPGFVVLEIGTGSGYQAAVLSEIVSKVYTIEIVKELASEATARLTKLNYKNAAVKTGDGYFGWKEHAPFDAIVVTAAAEHIPPSLIEQLKDGGRMVIPVGSPFMVQQLMLVEKMKSKVRTKSMMAVRFVPFKRNK